MTRGYLVRFLGPCVLCLSLSHPSDIEGPWLQELVDEDYNMWCHLLFLIFFFKNSLLVCTTLVSYDEPPRSPGGFRRTCKLICSCHRNLSTKVYAHPLPPPHLSLHDAGSSSKNEKKQRGSSIPACALRTYEDSLVGAPADCARRVRTTVHRYHLQLCVWYL